MSKNIFLSFLSILFGILIIYAASIFYFFFNLDSQISRQHIKSNEALILHKKYTSILHHVRYVPGVTPNSKIIPENYLFTRVKDFKKGKINILLQGDSWIEQQVRKIESHRILKNFSKNKDVGVINAGNYSYSPSPMMLQLDILEKDFDLRPDILVAFFDQSDLGDENCRYKRRRVFNKDGKLISLKPEKYSWHLFDYTKIHNESEIFFSDNNDFLKSILLVNFKIKYRYLRQKYKLKSRIDRIKNLGWKNRKFPSNHKCYWSDIERYLIDNNPKEIKYFKQTVIDYLNNALVKEHIKKIFLVTFPHQENLFPTKNSFGKEIFYNIDMSDIINDVSKIDERIYHINFSAFVKNDTKNIYNNAYMKLDPHLNEEYHSKFFTQKIIDELSDFINLNN